MEFSFLSKYLMGKSGEKGKKRKNKVLDVLFLSKESNKH